MKDKLQLDFKAMWNQLENDLRNAIKNPPDNISKETQEIAIKVFHNILEDMKIITRDFELKRMEELENKYKVELE